MLEGRKVGLILNVHPTIFCSKKDINVSMNISTMFTLYTYSRPTEIAEGSSRIQCNLVSGESDQNASDKFVEVVQNEISLRSGSVTNIIVSGMGMLIT